MRSSSAARFDSLAMARWSSSLPLGSGVELADDAVCAAASVKAIATTAVATEERRVLRRFIAHIPQRALLRAQGLERIDSHGSARRNVI